MDDPRAAAQIALDGLRAGLGPRGQWPSWVIGDPPTDVGRRDISPPVTALGMLALVGVTEAADILARSRPHLELTVLPDGMWRYYANIPPDTDDSAMCALALGAGDRLADRTGESIARTVLPDGRFPTWYEPGWAPAVDAVANANVVALLGEQPVTMGAIDWLDDVVARGREVESSQFYVDELDLHLAIRRAVDRGVAALGGALRVGIDRAHDRLTTDDLSPYRTAQALAVIAGAGDPRARLRAVEALISAREGSGCWTRETLFVAGRTDVPGRWLYQSWSVVTALCARALLG